MQARHAKQAPGLQQQTLAARSQEKKFMQAGKSRHRSAMGDVMPSIHLPRGGSQIGQVRRKFTIQRATRSLSGEPDREAMPPR
jgi:hypothetical protein